MPVSLAAALPAAPGRGEPASPGAENPCLGRSARSAHVDPRLHPAEPAWTGNGFWITGNFAVTYEQRHAELGLPTADHAATQTGFEQKFEEGKPIWENATRQIKVVIG